MISMAGRGFVKKMMIFSAKILVAPGVRKLRFFAALCRSMPG
jgi:hypothetical protein